MKILLLEDDIVLAETLVAELQEEGYAVEMAKHGEMVYNLTSVQKYDLYIFDVNVPYIDGFTLLKELRQSGDETPLIFLTSKDRIADKESGFEAGCDDYLCKPFALSELKYRIKALLKRTAPVKKIAYGDIEIDLTQKYLKIGDEVMDIEYKALQILHLFVSNPGKIFSLSEIIDAIYAPEDPSFTVIRVHISKINALFSQKRIKNVRGVGYKYGHL